MNLEVACRDLKEPGVIDEKILYNAIIEQGPKGEEGRLFKEQGIVYEEVTHLRLEYLGILKIDHLWIMTGLRKLQLCNNSIEKIENLHYLVNLKELDMSFNYIGRIENLDALVHLEVLTLFQNKIEIIENINHLTNLTVFSIGNNNISENKNVIYLRGMANLKSLNMAGNPICQNENFVQFVIAHVPQLVYYEYRMISVQQKEAARELFLNNLMKLEREEEEMKEIKMKKLEEEKQERLNAEAFVEYLGGSQLFLSLFEKDAECKILLQMGDNVKDAYEEFKKNFCDVTKELYDFGLAQLEIRKAEMARFEKYIGEAKEKVYNESREIMEDFLKHKTVMFNEVREILSKEVEEGTANETSFNVQVINEAFRDLCHRAWTALMKKELILFEAAEEVNGTYERTLTEIVSQFIEGTQAQFTQLRQFQNSFNETLTDTANKFFTNYTVATATKSASQSEFRSVPQDLANMMQDKEYLINALSASHDYHLLLIDQREDKLISGIKQWLSDLVENLVNSEINRNRNTITEINHFLDFQKSELQKILSTPVGLLLLPKEVVDALQL